MKFSAITISICSLLITCSAVTADTGKLSEVENRMQKCIEPWCLSVAGPASPWPAPLRTATITIEEHPAVEIDIPTGFKRIRRVDYFLMFTYDNKKVLTLEEISKEAFPDLRENTKNSKMTMADAAHVTFTKTTKDKSPDFIDDKSYWYWAMYFKLAFFEKDTPVYAGKKGPLTIYYLTGKWNGGVIVNKAVIVNDDSPNYVLKLGSANMTFDEFKSIIGTIKETRETAP